MSFSATRRTQNDELVGTFHRQASQHNLVHERKNRGIGADTKGERKNRHGGEARILRQHAQPVTDILPERVHRQRSRTNQLTISNECDRSYPTRTCRRELLYLRLLNPKRSQWCSPSCAPTLH